MIKYMQGQTAEELNFNWDLKELKEAAAELEIKGRSKMNKIQLAMAIDERVN
jgi:predicted GIY-YIG superfamily endonuclease